MTNPSPEHIADLLQPYIHPVPLALLAQLSIYLDLLLRWNARTNLTSIRDPEEIITRHFGESLFAATVLSPYLSDGATLLDFGSGAGFPGLPTQLFRPDLHVTLAESQHKKAAFLREVIRSLNLPTSVHAGRVQTLAPAVFDCITLRAVDNMTAATREARQRLRPEGLLAIMASRVSTLCIDIPLVVTHSIPSTEHSILTIYRAAAI